MDELLIMNLITNIIDISLLYYFLSKIFKKSEKDNTIIGLLLTLIIVISTFINTKAGLVDILGFGIMLIIMIIVFSFLFHKENILKVVFLVCTGLVLMFLVELVVIGLIIIVFGIPTSVLLEFNLYRILAIILAKASFYILIRFGGIVFSKTINKVKEFNSYSIVLLVMVNLFIVFMTFVFYSYVDSDKNNYMNYVIAMGVSTIIISVIVWRMIKKAIDQEKQKLIWKTKEEKYEGQTLYLKHIQEVIETLRAQRHDFNNCMTTIYGLVYLGKTEQAKEYILNLSKEEVDLNEIIDVTHPVIGAILNMKKEKAKRNQIEFNVDINIPEELPFNFVDLSTILGNLLDNAIESCEKISGSRPKINIDIYIKDDQMIINIENCKDDEVIYNEEQLISRITTKVDKENHGLGLMNVRKVVKDYKGIMKIEDMGLRFLVNISLPIIQGNNDTY